VQIGLISDTHIPDIEKTLPTEIAKAFRGVDLILHAGDIYIPTVLDDLEHIAPVLAARGDDDYGDMVRDRRVKSRHVLKLEGQTVWLVHERPDPYKYTPDRVYMASSLAERLRLSLEAEPYWHGEPDAPSIVVFGHEHCTVVDERRGVLFVSPGSPTFLGYRRGLGTVGIMSLNSGSAQVRIVQL
jgi:hypothetical protein